LATASSSKRRPITPPTATISKPYATALNESRRTRSPGGELMNCLLRPATAVDLASNLVAMSAVGTKQTSISTLNMSAFGGKADISDGLADVR
jgi:hypothetical protein